MTLKRRTCPACNHHDTIQSRLGLVAPWVRELAGVNQRFTKYFICKKCESGYSDIYYSDVELRNLYDNYRGEKYLRIRTRWESSYSQKLNDSIDGGSSHLSLRKNKMESLISQTDPEFHILAKTILDIGGGHGGLIPEWENLDKKFVLDISGVEPNQGVIAVASWSELLGESAIDLTMACGILEHLNSPGEFLQNIRFEMLQKQLISRNSLFYFEVPSGVPTRSSMPVKFALAAAMSFYPILWRKYDSWSMSKSGKGWPLRIAEHVQFFSEAGLMQLIELSGFEVLEIVDYSAVDSLLDSSSIRFSNIIGVLARIKQDF